MMNDHRISKRRLIFFILAIAVVIALTLVAVLANLDASPSSESSEQSSEASEESAVSEANVESTVSEQTNTKFQYVKPDLTGRKVVLASVGSILSLPNPGTIELCYGLSYFGKPENQDALYEMYFYVYCWSDIPLGSQEWDATVLDYFSQYGITEYDPSNQQIVGSWKKPFYMTEEQIKSFEPDPRLGIRVVLTGGDPY